MGRQQDIFDALAISFREDSYTEILAHLFNSDRSLARAFFGQTMDDVAPPGPVKAMTRTSVAGAEKGRRDIPDLIVLFGDPPQLGWVIEVKIRAAEGKDQTERYLKSVPGDRGPRYGLADDRWAFAYLTLDGSAPSCSAFRAIDFGPLAGLLDQVQPEEWLAPAVHCLRSRLQEAYAPYEVPEEISVAEYLAQARRLLTKPRLLSRLLVHATSGMGFASVGGIVHNRGAEQTFCQLRRPGWTGRPLSTGEAPDACFDIHLEAVLVPSGGGGRVELKLHYEANPYRPGLSRNDASLLAFWARRDEFASRLEACWTPPLRAAGWRLTRTKVQLARSADFLPLDATVAQLRDWLVRQAVPVADVVDEAVKMVNTSAPSNLDGPTLGG